MKNKEIDQLKELLNKWFNETDLAARNLFNQNKIAKLIKSKLIKNGNWKDQPRGNKNNIDNLNKGKLNRKELENKLNNIPKCKCGGSIEVVEQKNGKVNFICSNSFTCEFT